MSNDKRKINLDRRAYPSQKKTTKPNEMNEMNELHGCISIAGVKFGSWYGHTFFLNSQWLK